MATSMIKLRYKEARYTPEGLPEKDPFTGRDKVNHGKLVFVNARGELVTILPGETFETTREHATLLCQRQPDLYEEETKWQEFLAKLNRVKPSREQARAEHKKMLERAEQERLAEDRLRLVMAEREASLRQASALATQKERVEQDNSALAQRVEQLLAQFAEQKQAAEQRIAELESRLAAQSEGRRGRKPAQSQEPPHTEE